MSDDVMESADTGLTIDEIHEKYTDPRFDLLRDPEYMSEQHWAILEMFMVEVMVNAITTSNQDVIREWFPSAVPALALEVALDSLASEQAVRHWITGTGGFA